MGSPGVCMLFLAVLLCTVLVVLAACNVLSLMCLVVFVLVMRFLDYVLSA